MYRVHWLRICFSGRKNQRADPMAEEAPWHAGGCTRPLSWGRDFLCEIEHLWWTMYAGHQQGSVTLLLLADITYMFCGGVACQKCFPQSSIWCMLLLICRGAFEKKLAFTLLGHVCFCTMGPTKKGNFGPVCLSYPATKSVHLTTREYDDNFSHLGYGLFFFDMM